MTVLSNDLLLQALGCQQPQPCLPSPSTKYRNKADIGPKMDALTPSSQSRRTEKICDPMCKRYSFSHVCASERFLRYSWPCGYSLRVQIRICITKY
jgi:hypothetical protein